MRILHTMLRTGDLQRSIDFGADVVINSLTKWMGGHGTGIGGIVLDAGRFDWKGERFPNGRPRVPDDILRRMQNVVTEEAWSVLWREGYQFQFEGNWTRLHPDRILVGEHGVEALRTKVAERDPYGAPEPRQRAVDML